MTAEAYKYHMKNQNRKGLRAFIMIFLAMGFIIIAGTEAGICWYIDQHPVTMIDSK